MNKQTTSLLAARLRLAIAVLLLMLWGSVPRVLTTVSAQQPTKTALSSPKGGPKEGLKVHGHWIIDVRNPDGSLVSHNEFENELVIEGAQSLAFFLSRSKTPGLWSIVLRGGACPGDFGSPGTCKIFEASSPFVGGSFFKNLTVAESSGKLVLSGSATASNNASITSVETTVGRCDNQIASGVLDGACKGVVANLFTYAQLTAPGDGSCPPNTQCVVPVAPGQQILVTVTISFS